MVVAYLLACFVSSLQSIFVSTAPVPRALNIPWCSYLLWQRELGLLSALHIVCWVQRQCFGMQFTLGFTLITLTSLSKETKRTKPRNRISIKIAFPEVGLSSLWLPCTGCRNASLSFCRRVLSNQFYFILLYFKAVKVKIKWRQTRRSCSPV